MQSLVAIVLASTLVQGEEKEKAAFWSCHNLHCWIVEGLAATNFAYLLRDASSALAAGATEVKTGFIRVVASFGDCSDNLSVQSVQ